jgi:hypothetical protein
MSINEKNSAKTELFESSDHGISSSVAKVVLSALSGLPVVGSFIGAAGTAWSEYDQNKFQQLLKTWLAIQEDEIKSIGQTLAEVVLRVDQTDEQVKRRMQSPEYLSLVKKCFREWSATDSEEKRTLIRNLLVNAAAENQLCSDDILRMFIRWIDTYSEAHFRVIREIHNDPGITRYEMWMKVHGERVREDSAEADLFKLIFHELSIGMIIRQHRETDAYGHFLKQPKRRTKSTSNLMKSAFDDEKEYHLTELGRWFVHYTMNEIVPKIEEHSRI